MHADHVNVVPTLFRQADLLSPLSVKACRKRECLREEEGDGGCVCIKDMWMWKQ